MLSKTYSRATGEISHQLPLSHEWGALQVVTMAGQHLYRAVRSAKCRACRNAAKRFRLCCAPVRGRPCPICGNPYVYGLRPPRHRPDAPVGQWQSVRLH